MLYSDLLLVTRFAEKQSVTAAGSDQGVRALCIRHALGTRCGTRATPVGAGQSVAQLPNRNARPFEASAA
jgi:hypothetical protein